MRVNLIVRLFRKNVAILKSIHTKFGTDVLKESKNSA